MFHDLSTPVIFLQNVVTDFLLGLGFNEAFRIFANRVRERYQAEPGFITMNAPVSGDGWRRSASPIRSSARQHQQDRLQDVGWHGGVRRIPHHCGSLPSGGNVGIRERRAAGSRRGT